MIGIKGEMFTNSFEWIKWRPTKSILQRMRADQILTDSEAEKIGIAVQMARISYMGQINGRENVTGTE